MDKRRRLMALVMTSMLVLSSCSAPAGSDYEKARELFAKGQYAQARELFALHADYKNTQQYLGYIDAWAKVEAGDYAGASEAFAELSDFLDSAEEARAYARVADDRTYFNALEAFLKGDYASARADFELVRGEMESDTYLAYLDALDLQKNGEIEKALEAFRALDGFRDSREISERLEYELKDLDYGEAEQYLASGDLDKAQEIFLRLGEYRDTRRSLLYIDAMRAEQAEQFMSAMEIYADLGRFRDAQERETACRDAWMEKLYQEAVSFTDQDALATATDLFGALAGYADSDLYLSYLNARSLMGLGKYRAASEQFAALGDFRDSAERAAAAQEAWKEEMYQKGILYFEQNKPSSAAYFLERICGYKDSLQYLLYMEALDCEAQGLYADALDRLWSVPGFLDADSRAEKDRELLEQIILASATDLMDDGNYGQARDMLREVTDLPEAEAYREWLDAEELARSGDYGSAAELMSGLGPFLGAGSWATGYTAMQQEEFYGEAVRSLEKGDFERAESFFMRCDGFQDSTLYLSYMPYLAQGMLSTATDLASFPAETLQKAENGLLQLNGFLDSTEQAERIGQAWRTMVYEEAVSDLESGNLDSAAEKMGRVHPFEDSASYLTYIKAMLLKSQGQYAAAANGFAALGSFLDSSEMRSECSALDQEQRYVRALGLLARGDLEEAEALFSGLGNFQDAQAMCLYAKARQLEKKGNTSEALNAYRGLTVMDSAVRARELSGAEEMRLLENARAALEAGQLQEALDMLADAEDAASVQPLKDYLIARLNEENGELSEALAGYDRLTSGVEDSLNRASELRAQLERQETARILETLSGGGTVEEAEDASPDGIALYRQALAWEQNGNLDGARMALAAVASLPGAQEQLERVNQLALEAAVDSGDWKKAEALLKDMPGQEAELSYVQGRALLEKGQYSEAAAMLEGLEIRDSREQAAKAEAALKKMTYASALEAFARGAVMDAAAAFEELSGYEQADLYTAYIRGMQLENGGDYAGAVSVYRELGSFLDAEIRVASLADREKLELYREGLAHLEKGEYEEVVSIMGLLGEAFHAPAIAEYARARSLEDEDPEAAMELYEGLETGILDSRSRRLNLEEEAADADRMLAMELMEEGTYTEALSLFRQLEGAEDYASYCEAAILEAEGHAGEAEEAYLALGDFLDSAEKAQALTEARTSAALAQAQELMESGSWQDALNVMDRNGLASDARTYANARVLESEGRWLEAAGLYADIPEYGDSGARRMECGKLALEGALLKGNLDEAEALIPAWSGEETRYAEYLSARRAQESGDMVNACKAYMALGTFLDSATRSEACMPAWQEHTYLNAVTLFGQGSHAEAGKLFEALGDFRDAASYAKYIQMEAQIDSGSLKEAEEGFRALGMFLDAETLARYVHALSLEKEGNLEEAEAVYASMTGYRDAQKRCEQIRNQWQDMRETEAMDMLAGGWDSDVRESFLNLLPQGGSRLAETLAKKARELMENGDWTQALGLAEILTETGFEQADALEEDAILGLASKQMEEGEYAAALATLERSDVWDARERNLQIECHRSLAEQAMAENRFALAEQELLACGTDPDAASMLKGLVDRYEKAVSCLKAGELKEAAELFRNLNDFRDAGKYRMETEYRLAAALAGQGKAEEASALYASLGGYADASERVLWPYEVLGDMMAREGRDEDARRAYAHAGLEEEGEEKIARAHYERAVEYVLENDPEMACAEFALAGGELDAAVRAQETRIAWGDRLREEGKLEEALEVYAGCEEGEARSEREEMTWIQIGEQLLAEEKWAEAADAFTKAGHLPDDAAVGSMTYGILAQRLLEQGRYTEAQEVFDQAGMHEEGMQRIREKQYQNGISLYRSGLLREAEDAFRASVPYLDAQARLEQTILDQGDLLLKEGAFAGALEAYARAGDSDAVTEKKQAAYYAMAEDEMKRGLWDEASGHFLQAGSYRDAQNRIHEPYRRQGDELAAQGLDAEALKAYRKAGYEEAGQRYIYALHYQKATRLLRSGDYREASAEFGLAGSYLDAENRQEEALIALGNELARNGRIQEAAEVYASLRHDSELYIHAMYLDQAQTLLNLGQLDEAMEAYELAGEADLGRQRLAEEHYARAAAFLKEGDYVSASAEFELCGDWLDASSRVQANMLHHGDELLEQGLYEEALKAYEDAYPDTERDSRLARTWYAYAGALAEKEAYEAASHAYAQAGDYLDAREKVDEPLMTLIRKLASEGSYDEALLTAEGLVHEANRTAALQTIYTQAGDACMLKGSWEEAAQAYENAGNVSGVHRARYSQGEELEKAGDMEGAAAAFAGAADYSDADSRRKECLYVLAGKLVKQASYEKAYDLYRSIQDYRDVETILRRTGGLLEVARTREGRRNQFQLGRYVRLGKWEQDNVGSAGGEDIQWMVLSIEGSRVLLVSRYALETMPSADAVAWMNGTFLDLAFYDSLRQALSGEEGEKVFSLSSRQVQTYLVSGTWMQKAKAVATRHARSHGASATYRDGFGSYYLSDEGDTISVVNASGEVQQLTEDMEGICVRPAILLDLDIYMPR